MNAFNATPVKNKKPRSVPIKEQRWECPSCKNRAKTPFCSQCGEVRPPGRPVTLLELLKQLFNGLTSVDGKFLRSVRYLLGQPGVLTTAYMQGRQVLYLGPIQLFLVANVLFFALQSITNTNIVSSTLDSHLHVQDWGSYAQTLVAQKLISKKMTLGAYAPIFDQAIVFYGKLLIILMAVPFTLFLYIATLRKHRPFTTHIVFSLHFFAFLLLLFCFSLVLAEINVAFGGKGLSSANVDTWLTLLNLVTCTLYLYMAIGVVYDKGRLYRSVIAAALGLSVTGILLAYRFALLIITIAAT